MKHLSLFFLSLLIFLSGCGKKNKTDASVADAPVHEQLLALLETSARKRCDLAEARVSVLRFRSEVATELQTRRVALEKLVNELSALRGAYKEAQAVKATRITVAEVAYSEPNFRLLVGQKIRDRKNIEARLARYEAQGATYDDNMQKISLTINELNSREEEAKENINDLLRGRQIAGIKTLLASMGSIDVAAVTSAVKELDKPNEIIADAEKAVFKETPQSAAEVADFLQ
jgi:hypothetical protein